MRKMLGVLGMCVVALLGTPFTAGAVPALISDEESTPPPTTNLVSKVFAKTTGGVSIAYWCYPVAGDTQVQIVSPNQLTAHRSIKADCDGTVHDLGSLNAPSHTAMRVRMHNYSGNAFNGGFAFGCAGRWL